MKDWLWHLLNDPMRDNPWSLGLLVLLVGSWFAVATAPLVKHWWRHRR